MGRKLKVKIWNKDKTIRQNAILNGVSYKTAACRCSRELLPHKYEKKINSVKPVVCYGIDTNWNKITATYESAREAQRKTGILHTSISMCISGRYKTAGGLRWEFKINPQPKD